MKLFTKIFLSVFCLTIVLIAALSSLLIRYQISYAEQKVIEQNMILGSFIAEEIRVGYFQSQWPYESLSRLTNKDDFLFWWVVRENGSIYRSDNTAFMGTRALEYFPQMLDKSTSDYVYSNIDENFAVYIKPFKVGSENWEFWLGFSTIEFESIRNTIFSFSIVPLGISIILLGVALYFVILFFTRPIGYLVKGTQEVAKGNLDYSINTSSKDELGNLGIAFNAMTRDLKKSRIESEDYNRRLEADVKAKTADLNEKNLSLEKLNEDLKTKYHDIERFNKLMIDRELKIVELKNELDLAKEKLKEAGLSAEK